jgi:hypothetical protein
MLSSPPLRDFDLDNFFGVLRTFRIMKPKIRTILMILTLLSLEPLAKTRAVSPPPDGGYPGGNTAEGQSALVSLTTGGYNTAVGFVSLRNNTTASYNTAVGAGTLASNTGDFNTAVGTAALLLNTSGFQNTATGADALAYNNDGYANTANGDATLFSNIRGSANSAFGAFALYFNSTGDNNSAFGYGALQSNDTGFDNTAMGVGALDGNVDGVFNTATGAGALGKNTHGVENNAFGALALASCGGSDNTALGYSAGGNLITGDGNVYIGAGVAGASTETDHTYIRNINTTSVNGAGTDTVTVNLSTGLLGHLSSSRRYKEDIRAMDKSSETLYRLQPVTYRFKKDIDPSQGLDYGLIAEDVAKVDSNLAIRDRNGHIESVRYKAVNAMLLNEFLKQHKAFIEEQHKVQKLEAALASVNERLNEHEAKIDKVSAQVETSRPGPQVVQVP